MLKVKVAYREYGTGKFQEIWITAESYEEAIKLFITIHPFDHLVSVQ
jgi:hypothetical protein